MKYIAVIEIPKGCDRRIHMAFDKSGFVDLGPIKDQISVNDGVMPVHYGYFENTYNKDDDDNVDVLVFSARSYQTGDKAEVEIIGLLTREDGDHKVLAVDDSILVNSFDDVPSDERQLILDYFGYKSKVISIVDKVSALKYLADSKELLDTLE